MRSAVASIRFVGAISSPSVRHDGYSRGCRNQNSSFRELMAKSRLSPVDETVDAWGSRYASCLLRSQNVASARCRATAPMVCLPLIRPIGLTPPAAGIRDAVHQRAAPAPPCLRSAAAHAYERHLREILSKYVNYYNGTRTHLSLSKDAPEPSADSSTPSSI